MEEDLLRTLDEVLATRHSPSWDMFYADRGRPCPFFVDLPDEKLVDWLATGTVRPGRVLELGCGNGRNAARLLGAGCRVDAIDLSADAIAWATERAPAANFQCRSIFAADIEPGAYDLVYDSGCFHHLPPHRRKTYVDLVMSALKPGAHMVWCAFDRKAEAGSPTGRFTSGGASAAALATPKSNFGSCGTGRHFRSNRSAR